MNENSTLKILFVINPGSGTKSKKDWESISRDYFKTLPHKIEFFLLSGKEDADTLKIWIKRFEPDRVVAVGGDGTVSLVAELLLNTGIAMGILPAGSANGMAKELSIPETTNGAMNIILNGDIRKTDVIRINDNYISLHLSDLGVNAQLVKYFEEGKLRGKLGYAKVVLRVLLHKQKMRATITTDSTVIKTHAFMIVIANASKYGTGALINPEGNLHDGKFEIVIVRKLAFFSVLKIFLQFKKFNPDKVELIQATSATIVTTKKIDFQVDGEYHGKMQRVTATVVPGQLCLLLPAQASAGAS